MITAAVSEMLLVADRSALQKFDVDSPPMEEAAEVVCKPPRLRKLRVVIDRPGSLPTLMLPNLVEIHVEYDHGHGWLQGFRGGTLGNLTSVAFYRGSHLTYDFFESLESAAFTSIPATLSRFNVSCSSPQIHGYQIITRSFRSDSGRNSLSGSPAVIIVHLR